MSKIRSLLYILIFISLGVIAGVSITRSGGTIVLNGRNLSFSSPSLQQNTVNRNVVREESAVIDVVKKVGPSVVSIGVSQRVFNPFDPGMTSQPQNTGIGTGFIVSKDGVILTNRHVVNDPNATYTVVTKDNRKLNIGKIYRDTINDLALIKVDAADLPPVELGDSDSLQVGQFVIAIGNALGMFDNTVTTGVVSGLGRGITAGDPFSGGQEKLQNVIQTDAAINPGNSGGPLLDLSGKVIGINTAMATGQNIGFTIPINTVKLLVSDFLKTGKISRPYLGISYQQITRDLALLNGVPQGAYVRNIIVGSPSEKAGVQIGDIITKIDGTVLTDKVLVADLISQKKVGDRVELTIWRNEKEIKLFIALGETP